MTYVISYDIGTTGVKTCLFEIDEKITLKASAQKGYSLYIDENGGAEQDADEWWEAMCFTTKELFKNTLIKPTEVRGISFCTQMQGLVLVDENGNAVRRPMSYLDQRAKKEIKKGIAYGLQFAGANILKLIKSVIITGAVSSSVKDPLWKYKWVQNNEPQNFAKTRYWVDVKEYLLGRCTGNFVMTQDSAYSTFLMDTRKGKNEWSESLVKTFGVKREHLPKIVKSTDCIGGLTKKAASELGLTIGTPVFGGGGDATLIGIGAGCVNVGDTHV
ncbi:MAG TPA: FGGY family carbohydrate kinase, partial [Clostridia bacterium]|nr:FGGY family carbohydrate kinase [Clostridia bacterium]